MSKTVTLKPISNTTNSYVTNPNYAYDNDTTTYATFTRSFNVTSTTAQSGSATIYYNMDFSSVPANAIILGGTLYARAYRTGSGASGKYTVTRYSRLGLYNNTSAINSNIKEITNTSIDDLSVAIPQSTTETWVQSSNPRIRMYHYLSAKKSSSSAADATFSNTAYLYNLYVVIEYELNGVQSKIKVNGSWVNANTQIKVNGEWVTSDAGYVKVNGSWEEFSSE